MDVAMSGGKEVVDDYLDTVVNLGIDIIEISRIARSLDDDEMCELIENATDKGIKVINEVGVAFAFPRLSRRNFCRKN